MGKLLSHYFQKPFLVSEMDGETSLTIFFLASEFYGN